MSKAALSRALAKSREAEREEGRRDKVRERDKRLDIKHTARLWNMPLKMTDGNVLKGSN